MADVPLQYKCPRCALLKAPAADSVFTAAHDSTVVLKCGHLICVNCSVDLAIGEEGQEVAQNCPFCPRPFPTEVVVGARVVGAYVDEVYTRGGPPASFTAGADLTCADPMCLDVASRNPSATKRVALHRCDCGKALCRLHGELHREYGHALKALQPFSVYPSDCQDHDGGTYHFACTAPACEKMFCITDVREHPTTAPHSVVELKDAAAVVKPRLADEVATFTAGVAAYGGHIDALSTALARVTTLKDTALEDIARYQEDLIAAVVARCDTHRAKVLEFHRERTKVLAAQKQRLEVTQAQIGLGLELSNAVLLTGNPSGMFATREAVKAILPVITPFPGLDTPAELSFDASSKEAVKATIAAAGRVL